MTFALTIGSYRLLDFVHLGIKQIQKVFPDAPILISDDHSERSDQIAKLATGLGCTYAGSNSKRGHFAGDLQSILSSIQFAVAHNCDLAIKVSQRFVFKNEAARPILLDYFSTHDHIAFGLPGKLDPKTLRPFATFGFTKLPMQTDLMVFRVKDIDPNEMVEDYRKKVANIHYVPHGSFIEGLAADLFHGRWKDKSAILDDFTSHVAGREGGDLYLRRSQNHDYDYRDLAKTHGVKGDWSLAEWSQLDKQGYWPYPRA